MSPEQFVEALQARGIELSVVNNRLKLDPGVAWKALTPDEVHCLKDHRAAIKRLADGSEPTAKIEPGSEPSKPTTPPEPETDGLDTRLHPSHHATGPARHGYHRHEPSVV